MNREYSSIRTSKREIEEGTEPELINIAWLIDDAFKGLRRFWVWFLVVISVFSSIFYIHEKRGYVPQYYAASTFVVNRSSSVNYQESYYNRTTTAQLAKTFPYIIMNDALQHLIADDLGVESVPGTVEATTLEDTNMITLSVTAYTPEDAYNILQSVIKNYPQIAKSVVGETELNIIDETGMPQGPMNAVSGRRAGVKGFLAGCVICFIWLFVYALTRKTIRREDDFKNMLNVKCFCTIPLMRFKKRSKTEKNRMLIDNPHVSYGFVEANRTLRTRIEKDALKNDAKIYLVSGAEAQEGKSIVAVNLALSLATKGKKVIIVDLDLRHPSVAEKLGLEKSEKGFIDVLRGKATVEDIMVPYKDSSLYVLQGGRAVSNTAQILASKRVGEVCKKLRDSADYVIIDTPPSGLLSDAAQIVKCVDAGIFVVRQDYAPLESILEGIEMLSDSGLRLAGCVLNCAEVGITGYGNGYGYGYGRYGYGSYGRYGSYGKYGSQYVRDLDKNAND